MAIFRKTRIFNGQFWILFFFSVLLIGADYRHVVLPQVKPYLQMLAMPFEYVVVLPERIWDITHRYLVFQKDLVHDKQDWQNQKLILEAQLQELNALKLQNRELQSLLKTTPIVQDQKYLLAQVTAIHSDAFTHEMLLNHGSRDDVKMGQAVVAEAGVVGQVIQVNPLNSRVMLLSDTRAAIPVVNQRTHENFIVVGTGNDTQLGLLNLPASTDLKVGDLLLSSGMGGHFPMGYPVGVVHDLENLNKSSIQVHVKPTVHLNRLQMVLILLSPEQSETVS